MKKTILLTTLLLAGTFIISGCGESKTVKEKDLLHHRFLLVKANGKDISSDKQAELEFGENMHISGKMCNQFAVNVTLKDDVIKGSGMAMTKMLCDDDQLDKLDSVIEQLITEGVHVALDDDQLILKNNDNELIYKLKDLI